MSLEALQYGSLALNIIMVLVILPLRSSIDKLQRRDEEIAREGLASQQLIRDRLQALEVEVAKNYTRRGEMDDSINRILVKLDTFEQRMLASLTDLDHAKQDKNRRAADYDHG